MDDVLNRFHPVIQTWFRDRFEQPTAPQVLGWPEIAAGHHTLIAAPTGSGKTLTAFLAVIDRLLRQEWEATPGQGVQVVYVSPLRALSNDMQRNLEKPLAEINETAREMGLDLPQIRVGLRTGDTTSYQRQQIVKKPPQILVTTPESLYLMLTSARSREVLQTVDTVIVDEIHALVRDKRGSHLALTLERLEALIHPGVPRSVQRIGLSATQKPIERMAEFLVGGKRVTRDDEATGDPEMHRELPFLENVAEPLDCRIVDVGHKRDLDLAIETPPSDLSAVCSHEQWAEVNARLVELIQQHRSTLIFVNTRRMAERVTFQLTHLLGEDAVGAHHGSLSKEIRLSTEQRLKSGELKAVVATASLELGIDVGYIDLVVQLGSPRSIAAFLQRIGRSGHALGLVPKGRLFALTRDELMESMAMLRAVQQGRLDVTPIPTAPLDILAQQIVAEVACEEWSAEELFERFTLAYPYRELPRKKFDDILKMLSEGLTETSGRKQALIYYDRINDRLKGRPAARLTAINNGGAIPEIDSIRVVLEDEKTVVGSVDEEFAVESSAGDIFLLGNSSWRIHGLRGTDLYVGDAHGAPPTIPFWQGEAPGRTLELSEEISQLRMDLESKLIEVEQLGEQGTIAATVEVEEAEVSVESEEAANGLPRPVKWKPLVEWLQSETCCDAHAAWQIVNYVAAQRAAVGFVPTHKRILFERFFDESGGMQLVVHAPFGGRINRAWGLAFRKRFCRSFDFELQATADDDGFILSLGPQHSFPLESLFPFMRTDNARNLLEQAMLIAPFFHARWRWNVTRALFLARMRNGKKVPPPLQRFRAQDLLTAVFPKLTGCQEEHMGDHEIPDHPLMTQTVADCMFEALDIEGLLEVLGKVEQGEITYVGRDTREPSPFAYELLNANPYAFLDGGEVQERRARAVATRRSVTVESVRDLGKLDPAAIAAVVNEAQPLIRDEDELHDLLLSRFLVPVLNRSRSAKVQESDRELVKPQLAFSQGDHEPLLYGLLRDGRVLEVEYGDGQRGWVATERWPAVQAISDQYRIVQANGDFDDDRSQGIEPSHNLPFGDKDWSSVDALNMLLKGWLESSGPVTAIEIAELLCLPTARVFAGLEGVEGEGLVLRGRFLRYDLDLPSDSEQIEWCHRGLLARIHRRTIMGLRKEIEAVDIPVYLEFLAQHQGVVQGHRKQGVDGLHDVLSQLQGTDLSAAAWEESILPIRVEHYKTEWLDELCMTGEVGWGRLEPVPAKKSAARPMTSITRVVPISLFLRDDLGWLVARRQDRSTSRSTENGQSSASLELGSLAEQVLEMLQQQGALFAKDMLRQTDMLPTHLNEALGELVAAGLITADGFSGLRRLTHIDEERPTHRQRARKTRVRRPSPGVGRWNLWQVDVSELSRDDVVEEWAWQLIRRWGIVFREVVQRETLAPPWWELSRAYRRLEARGEIRGGRFIKGVGGEQFGTSDAVRELRILRNRPAEELRPLVVLCGADPLNLTGILGNDERIPSLATHRVAYCGGHVVGWKRGEETWVSPQLSAEHLAAVQAQFGLKVTASIEQLAHQHKEQKQQRTATEATSDQQQKRRPRKRKQRSSDQIPKPFPF